jgi:glutathione synthase/RimK-type ligase-like ATP-grasp enzyme
MRYHAPVNRAASPGTSASRRLRVATCDPLPEPDRDQAPLMAALSASGIAAELVAWDGPSDWDQPVPTLLRSTWDYTVRVAEFLAWCERVAAASVLLNPIERVRHNAHKRYLIELAGRGVPTVPTVLLAAGEHDELEDRIAAVGDDLVIKPAVGAASRQARRFAAGDGHAACAHARALLGREDVLVQPYLPAVEGHGERSLVWIDGAISHAVRKSPRWSGGVEEVRCSAEMSRAEREVAEAAIAPWRDQLLYARIDLVPDRAGAPVVLELELIEPSLFFACAPGSADRLVTGLERRLLDAGIW